MVTDVLLDEAVFVMAAHHRIGKVDIFDHGLKFAAVLLGNFATEDHREFVGLPNRAIGIQQPIANPIESRSAREDQIVTILDLSEKQLVLDAPLLTLTRREEWCQLR
jgi:hypothetical protein